MEELYRYDVLDQIGEGSFGRVFRGRDKKTNEEVAIKLIHKAKMAMQLHGRSWKTECEIQKALKHPNIIRMIDSIETQECIFIITECAMGDIYNLFIKNGPLAIPKVQFMAFNLVSALEYLHERRILHRDLKPQNILWGYDGFPKLCDFGFARNIAVHDFMLTSFKGTPLYMAPEILHEKPYDQSADLWSLGCILYELATGEPPFPPTALMQFGRKFDFEPLNWPAAISGDCRSFLRGLLEKDPKSRLTWPYLWDHPFIQTFRLTVNTCTAQKPDDKFSLTKALTPSQEMAKERQRLTLQKKLDAYSKLLEKTKKKWNEAQKQLLEGFNDPPSNFNVYRKEGTNTKIYSGSDNSSIESLTSSSSSFTSDDGRTVLDTKSPTPNIIPEHSPSPPKPSNSIHSSKGNITSIKNIEETVSAIENLHLDERSSSRLFDILWISEGLYNVHSADKPIESEEWIIFMGKTMKEVESNPSSICDKHFLSVLVAPLGNHLAEVPVVEAIATLLAMPFTLVAGNSDIRKNLENIYFSAKVLPKIVYACKLIVRRRLLQTISLKSGDEVKNVIGIMTEEDLIGMDKCVRLITFLVHVKEEFVEQFCECVCQFKIFPILLLCLKAYRRQMRLTIDTLSVLCHIMRTSKGSGKHFQTFINEYDQNFQEINAETLELLSHEDLAVQAKAIRLLGYLMTYSEVVREKLVKPNSATIWKILSQAASHSDHSIISAVEFTTGQLRQFITPPSRNSQKDQEENSRNPEISH